jgi:hypothetical protein
VNLLKCYRLLLYFYPNDFRNQFSEEMVEVFNQRACECSPEKTAFIAFVFRRFFPSVERNATNVDREGYAKRKILCLLDSICLRYIPRRLPRKEP